MKWYAHSDRCTSAWFSADETTILSAGADGKVLN